MSLRDKMGVLAGEILMLGDGEVSFYPEKRAHQTRGGVALAKMMKEYLRQQGKPSKGF